MTFRLLTVLAAAALLDAPLALDEPPSPPKVDGAKTRKGLNDETPPEETARAALKAHNRERADAKVPPLSLDPKLTAAAQVQADDMASHGKMSHQGTDGSSPVDRIKRQGYVYQAIGENVAEGPRSVEGVLKVWMNSPHHRENILGKFTHLGIAVTRDADGTPYWCADFGATWPKLDPSEAASGVVETLNQERKTARLVPLSPTKKLSAAAATVAKALADGDTLDPAQAPGADLAAALKASGYTFKKVAEGVAVGPPAAAEAVKTWMDSPTQRQNVLGEFTEVGVGYANAASGKPYWCLILATPLVD